MISNDASYTGYKCYGSLMSTNSTSFTDSGQPIKRLNLCESDHDTPVLPQQKFPNIRRKKLASKEERDRFLHTFEERSTYRVNEVDLGFLERKRNVLKKKQELLNKTLLANKVNKKLTKSFSNENRQNGDETKIFEAKELQKSEKNDVNQAENVNTDRNSERTSAVNLPNETKTTINFNIYNGEIDRANFKGNKAGNDQKLCSPTSEEECPKINRSQSIEIDENAAEKEANGDKLEKETARETKNLIRSVLCCRTLYSVVVYTIFVILIVLSAFLAFKLLSHHKNYHFNLHNAHEGRKTEFHHRRANITKFTNSSIQTSNVTSVYQKFIEKANDRLQDFFTKLSNATLANTKHEESRSQLQHGENSQFRKNENLNRVDFENSRLPGIESSQLQDMRNAPLRSLSSSHLRHGEHYQDFDDIPSHWRGINEKRQKIPGLPLIHLLIPTPASVETQPTTPQPPSPPTTTTKPIAITTTTTITTPKTALATTTTTTTTINLNPIIEAARNVLSSLNIGNLSPSFNNAGDLGDSTQPTKNSPQYAAGVVQQPTINNQQMQQQYFMDNSQQNDRQFDDQDMFMDNQQQQQQQQQSWAYNNDFNARYYDSDRYNPSYDHGNPYGNNPNVDDVTTNSYLGNKDVSEERNIDLKDLVPIHEGENEDDVDEWREKHRKRSHTRATVDDGYTTSTTTSTTTPTTTTTIATTATTTVTTTTTTTTPIPPAQQLIAENVEQYMSPRILSHDPLEDMDRTITSDTVVRSPIPVDENDDSDDDDDGNSENDVRLSHRRDEFMSKRHPRSKDFREIIDNNKATPYSREMTHKRHDDDDDGDDDEESEDFDHGLQNDEKHHRHFIPVKHKINENNDDDDFKFTVSKLKASLSDDLNDMKQKLSKKSTTKDKDLAGVEKMIKILHHDDDDKDADEADDDASNSKQNHVKHDNKPTEINDDMMTTLKETTKQTSDEKAASNIMSLMLNEQKRMQSKDKPTPDLMSEFVQFEKAKIEGSQAKKRKEIPAKKKKTKTEVKTYKLKTCIQIKEFPAGTLVQIVKGPVKSQGKIKYEVRACYKKKGKRAHRMTCEDITYRISRGKLSVKSIGSKNSKKIYAVFGCKDDVDNALTSPETSPVASDDSDKNDDESEEKKNEDENEDVGSTDDDDDNDEVS